MKRLFLAPALGALALATAAPAFAQYGRPGPNDSRYGYSPYYEVRRIAYDNGFREGLEEGQKDARSRDRFYFQDEGDFQRADKGYSRNFGDKDRYQQSFRSGFADGYTDGYNRYARAGNYGGGNHGGGYYGRDAYGRGVLRSAYDIGARDGYDKGLEDLRDGDRHDPRRHKWYREGDHNYESRFGPREQFKDQYRRGFLSGYEQAYRGGRY
jgi:hypothetical protein